MLLPIYLYCAFSYGFIISMVWCNKGITLDELDAMDIIMVLFSPITLLCVFGLHFIDNIKSR